MTVAADRAEASEAVKSCFEGRFGQAGARVVIEEFLVGTELSFIALCDETGIVPLASSQDHKRLGDGDTGPNTGGMGAFSPSPLCDEAMTEKILAEVMEPTLAELKRRGLTFRGFLYAGLMVHEGELKVLEFNVRCGDPETQVLMLRCEGDLGLWLHATARELCRLKDSFAAANLVEGRSRRGDHGEPRVSGEQRRVCPSRRRRGVRRRGGGVSCRHTRRLLGVGDAWWARPDRVRPCKFDGKGG